MQKSDFGQIPGSEIPENPSLAKDVFVKFGHFWPFLAIFGHFWPFEADLLAANVIYGY